MAKFKAGRIIGLPANTGNDSSSKTAVTKIAQTNKGILCNVILNKLNHFSFFFFF